jgi:hypothetical protein
MIGERLARLARIRPLSTSIRACMSGPRKTVREDFPQVSGSRQKKTHAAMRAALWREGWLVE